jgi:uncharacterized protein (TIGR00297 family)
VTAPAVTAWAAGWFTGPAAATGALLAWVVLRGAGFPGLALLALFVVSGSVVGRARRGNGKREMGNADPVSRFPFPLSRSPSRRRAAQVIANGWTAALGAALVPLHGESGWALLAGGLAAAQADTWATEIGTRATQPPVLITTGAPVLTGTSGAITPLGTAAALLGAALVGGAAGAMLRDARLGLAATGAGVLAMLADSLLGATLQTSYRCVVCAAPSDDPRHCGAAARPLGGPRRLSNDGVNFIATGVGAALCALAMSRW